MIILKYPPCTKCILGFSRVFPAVECLSGPQLWRQDVSLHQRVKFFAAQTQGGVVRLLSFRLIVSLVVGITLVSLISSYNEARTLKTRLRLELQHRAEP